MKAWGLTASIPVLNDKCDKNCAYCISQMTGFIKPDPELVERNLEKVYTVAEAAKITTFLITSKREPMLNIEAVLKMCKRFNKFPTEIQTNGIWLNRHPECLKELYCDGMNVIAFSIDHLGDLEKYAGLFEEITAHRMIVRICLNLTDMIPVEMKFGDIFETIIKASNVRQLMFRNITTPSIVKSGPQYEWVKKHTDYDRYLALAQEFERIVIKEKKIPIRKLPFGLDIYGHKGISVSFSDYCLQETNNNEDIRSLVFLEDGHLYTSWSDPASILF